MNQGNLLVSGLLLVTALASAEAPLVISLSELPPLGSASLEGNGILGQFVAEAFKGKNRPVAYDYLPFARVVTTVENRTAHAAFFNLLQANEKDYFVVPLLRSSLVYFYKKSRFPQGLAVHDMAKLAPYRVGVVRGAPTIGPMKEAGLTLDLSSDEQQDFKKLQYDRIDLVSTVDVFGWFALNEIGARRADYGVTAPSGVVVSCFLLSRSLPQAQAIYDDFVSGWEAAKNSGRLVQILETVYGPGGVPAQAIP